MLTLSEEVQLAVRSQAAESHVTVSDIVEHAVRMNMAGQVEWARQKMAKGRDK